MFTYHEFSLAHFATKARYSVIRECSFSFAGKIPSLLDNRIVSCARAHHLDEAGKTQGIAGVIVPASLADRVPEHLGMAVAENPIRALNLVQDELAADGSGQWKSQATEIHPSAKVLPGAYIAEMDVVIGAGVTIHPNAIVLPRSIIGEGSTIGPGTVVGADAFDVDVHATPRRVVRQSGGVMIGRHVDIQAKCTVVRATYGGFTELGDETKLDCQVHFAHDSRAGRRVLIAACAEISGRVLIGDDTFIGPNASISNGINIGPRSHVTIGAVVTRDVPAESRVTGNFAVDHNKWLRFMRSVR